MVSWILNKSTIASPAKLNHTITPTPLCVTWEPHLQIPCIYLLCLTETWLEAKISYLSLPVVVPLQQVWFIPFLWTADKCVCYLICGNHWCQIQWPSCLRVRNYLLTSHNCFKTMPGDYSMKLVKIVPRLCKAIIKANSGYWYETYSALFNTLLTT